MRPFALAMIVFSVLAPGSSGAVEVGNISFEGDTRSYQIAVPDQILDPMPLVIVLHGGGGDASNAVRMTGFDDLALEEGFIAVFPNGSARLGNLRTWNAGHCCGWAKSSNSDDIAFISALIDEMERLYPIDNKRIFITGMSNGAMMTHRLGIALAQRIAAIAPVVGAVFGDEQSPNASVSTLIIVGGQDRNVPAEGGTDANKRGINTGQDLPYAPAYTQASFWADANGCNGDMDVTLAPEVETRSYTSCSSGSVVRFVIVKDNGHAWPGGEKGSLRGDAPSRAYDATRQIWAFFEAHPKP